MCMHPLSAHRRAPVGMGTLGAERLTAESLQVGASTEQDESFFPRF